MPQGSLLGEQLAHLRIKTHANQHDIALRCQECRTLDPVRAALGHRRFAIGTHIAGPCREPIAHQVTDDWGAHTTRADDPDYRSDGAVSAGV